MLDSEINFYKALTVDDTSSNGGLMSAVEYTSGALADVFPHVLKAERDAGSEKHRKVIIKIDNDNDESFLAPQLWFDKPTPADDYAMFFAASETDTEGDIGGSERKYGCADLSSDATLGGTTLVVTVEHADQTGMFVAGDVIRVTDMTDPLDGGTGNEEFHVISGTPSVSTLEITITTTDVLAYGYLVSGSTRVMSVYKPTDVACSVDNWDDSDTSAGTYDESTYAVVTDNIGTISQTWTLTFTDATNFTVEGNTVGFLASGVIGSDYSEDNTDFTKPYFTLLTAGWGGTWAQDDTLVFQTHPAAIEIWERRNVPAGSSSLSGNSLILVVAGESV